MKTLLVSLQTVIKRVTIVSVLGLTLWLGTGNAALASTPRDYHTNVTGAEGTARVDKDQKEVDGMYNYNDTDPRRDTPRADAKAKELLDNSKRIRQQTDGPVDAVKSALSDK